MKKAKRLEKWQGPVSGGFRAIFEEVAAISAMGEVGGLSAAPAKGV